MNNECEYKQNNIQNNIQNDNKCNINKEFTEAIDEGSFEKIIEILSTSNKVSVNIMNIDNGGDTALISLIKKADESVECEQAIKLLLSYSGEGEGGKVDIGEPNNIDITALMLSMIYCKNKRIIELLLSYYTEGEDRGEGEKLDINAKNYSGWTALMYAIRYCKSNEIIESLIKRKDVNINTKDNCGYTALIHISEKCSNDSIIKLILEREDVDINAKDNGGNTALMCAICKNYSYNIINEPFIDLLLSSNYKDKLDINATNNNGWNALMLCVDKSFDKGIQLLLTCGANDINLQMIEKIKDVYGNNKEKLYKYYILKLESRIQQLQILKPIHTQDDVMRSIVLNYI